MRYTAPSVGTMAEVCCRRAVVEGIRVHALQLARVGILPEWLIVKFMGMVRGLRENQSAIVRKDECGDLAKGYVNSTCIPEGSLAPITSRRTLR